ncbi:MAG: HlyC/CorC family transporter [Muribaculaceae bacterium]|nr:HlyC/CorC family transporter [Muribaculaceae bacterium]
MSDIIIILLLILLNGVFAMSEIAIISARKHVLEKKSKGGHKGAATALKLATDPDLFLSTIQIGITLIGILTGIFSGEALGGHLAKLFVEWGTPMAVALPVAKILVVAVVTYLTLVFGELVPKRIGMASADGVAQFMARPVYWLSVVAKPFVWLLAKSTSWLVSLCGIKGDGAKITEEEIKSIIQEGTEHGEVTKVEQDIMERVLLMGDLKVGSIMTHRADVAYIDVSADVEAIRAVFRTDLHDNYPVVNSSLDDVVGVITLKELILHLNDSNFDLQSLMMPIQAVYEDMSIYDCLEKLMAEHHAGFALVYDEFGECQGVITLRDIFEGLVGVVNADEEDPQIVARADGNSWLVDGQCSFYDFLVYFDMDDVSDATDYNIIGALILSRLGRFPETGEKITWNDFTLEVVDMDGVRIDKVLVTRNIAD